MAVPAHDDRDYEFAKEFKLPIKAVVAGGDIEKEAYTGDGEHINSEFLNGLDKTEGIQKMIAWLRRKRDWNKESNVPPTGLVV